MNETRRRRRLTQRKHEQRAADLGVRAPQPVTRKPVPFPGAMVVVYEWSVRP